MEVTFVVEGRRIRAKKDILSIHSPYFYALFNQDFNEKHKEEIELEDISYVDFQMMLLSLLLGHKFNITDQYVESLLRSGDRFDIERLAGQVEDYLMGKSNNKSDLSISSKFLLADRYRLSRLQVVCYDLIGQPNEQTLEDVERSSEFAQLSEAARANFDAVVQALPDVYGQRDKFPTNGSPSGLDSLRDRAQMLHESLPEVDHVEIPTNGFLASGVLAIQADYDHVAGMTHAIELCGLVWSSDDLVQAEDEDETKYGSPYLIVNKNRATSVDWRVEGYVEMDMRRISHKTKRVVRRLNKKYAFCFTNGSQLGRLSLTDRQLLDYNNTCHTFIFYTIHISSIRGIRKSPTIDFTAPSDLTDFAFMVEQKRISVNKQMLFSISPRFLELINDKDEVELEFVEHKEFINFLHWTYPSATRDLSASSMFDFLRVAQKLEIKIDSLNTSLVSSYISKSNIDCLLAEKIIFYHQFDFGDEVDLSPVCGELDDLESPKKFQFVYTLITSNPLFPRMTPAKKVLLLRWLEVSYDVTN